MRLPAVAACFLAAAIALACSPHSETPLDDAIIEFGESDRSSTDRLAVGLLEECSTGRYKRDDLSSGGSCLSFRDGDQIGIVDPESGKKALSLPGGGVFACSGDMDIAASDGRDITLYPRSSGKREIAFDDARDPVRALAVRSGMVYYYRGHQVFSLEMKDGRPAALVKDRFSPPDKKYYQVYLAAGGKVLGIIAGSGGSYYISAVNLRTAKTIVSNISASAPRASFTDDAVYYVAGGAGDWRLVRFTFQGKAKKEIRRFRDISSIEIASGGFVFTDTGGLWAQDYSGSIIRVPFDFRIAGKLGDRILLACSGKTYAVDFERFMARLDQLKIKVPEIFD